LKINRHHLILDIISKKDIETQEDLLRELVNIGVKVTQATISRDIKELRLIKILSPVTGVYKYAQTDTIETKASDKLIRIFSESIVSIAYTEHLIVIKTLSGSANVAGEAVDSLRWPEILGTIAGDNTVLIIVRNSDEVTSIVDRINAMITRSRH